jgi:hypothetical protein
MEEPHPSCSAERLHLRHSRLGYLVRAQQLAPLSTYLWPWHLYIQSSPMAPTAFYLLASSARPGSTTEASIRKEHSAEYGNVSCQTGSKGYFSVIRPGPFTRLVLRMIPTSRLLEQTGWIMAQMKALLTGVITIPKCYTLGQTSTLEIGTGLDF